MTSKRKLLLFPLLLALTLTFAGCGSLLTKTEMVNQTPTGSETNTVFLPAPKIQHALEQLNALNSLTAPVNPYSPIVAGMLTGVSGLLAWIAKRKTDEAAKANATAQTVILGVESAKDARVKDAIKTVARVRGNSQDVDSLVQYTVRNPQP